MIELKPLQNQVKLLVDDLRGQVASDSDLRARLQKEHSEAKGAERTGGTFETWLEDVLDQAAVAWVLGCVFVRFCEDNQLVDGLWLGGPEPHAAAGHAVEQRQAYLIQNPTHNDRHWLRESFKHLRALRGTAQIFDEHNPVWRFDISGQAAENLSEFFRRGPGLVSLRSDELDTRFLGDLYQDLSAHAKATYALLQTPLFVEEFILDRTFEPAVREFGLAETKVIDPTCGSGHFLLGAFARLLRKWQEREPATPVDTLVERALAQVTGVDLNPFAVAIARFRLVVAALQATGRRNLSTAYPVRVAAGDSLLNWGERSSHQGELPIGQPKHDTFAYFSEDADLLAEYLTPGRYTVVVGNPPYITVKDKTLNECYRSIYSACSGTYALTVPFAQRFFELAKRGDGDGDGAGHVGQITSNSFMKREFGKKLVNDFFASQVDLVEVIDASGAYIPGHGTPTVILVGRNRYVSPRYSGDVRTVLGVRGEPSQPVDAASGTVWSAIVAQINFPGSDSEWISVINLDRMRLSRHPWSLSGGGASGTMDAISNPGNIKLAAVIDLPVGRAIRAGADDAFIRPLGRRSATRANPEALRPLVVGEAVRDWSQSSENAIWYPYDGGLPEDGLSGELWRWRAVLSARRTFQGSMADAGLRWWDYMQYTSSAYRTPLSITWAEVATHNHFVLDRGGKVFKQTSPVIKLPVDATENDHLRLLGLLNSSTACFWLKQVSQSKAGGGVGRGMQDEAWEERYQFSATKLHSFPVPKALPLTLSLELDGLARRLVAASPESILGQEAVTRQRLRTAAEEWHSIRGQMIALQEELDWQVYRAYGLLDEDLSIPNPPELLLGERAFEIFLARNDANTEWFSRHGSTPITELPERWPAEYRTLVERRIAIIESDRNIALIEDPKCKRRWSMKRDKETWDWSAQQKSALRGWLLDRLESPELWGSAPKLQSVAQLADQVRHDDDFRAMLDLWAGSDAHDLVKTLGKLVADEYVPYLPADRYKLAGLRKRSQWERAWALQRREDAGEAIKDIPVPPKYAPADFLKASYWMNRGKLDVPKERFISYSRNALSGDAGELLGWAGWDHLQRAQALARLYLDRKTQAGWSDDRLLPILAGIAELEPWLHQWYAEPRPGYPGTPADFFTGLIDTELNALGADRAALTKLRGLEELS